MVFDDKDKDKLIHVLVKDKDKLIHVWVRYHTANVTALAGETTSLNCRVHRLGNRCSAAIISLKSKIRETSFVFLILRIN